MSHTKEVIIFKGRIGWPLSLSPSKRNLSECARAFGMNVGTETTTEARERDRQRERLKAGGPYRVIEIVAMMQPTTNSTRPPARSIFWARRKRQTSGLL